MTDKSLFFSMISVIKLSFINWGYFVKDENVKAISVNLPVSFHLWIAPRAKSNERVKGSEIKVMCSKIMELNPDPSELDEHLLDDHTKNTKWVSLQLPLSFHLWLENRVKESERPKAEELKLLCLWMQQQENQKG
ncbi:hypothetical protein AB7Z60_16475 [Proteus mirabilis]|uniref:hypothetical protein n=1 Tax=Morganellaceae TaxID=1903414 RepID=UPI00234A3A9F|nr:hypothetical protein [Providencia sp. PROV271]